MKTKRGMETKTKTKKEETTAPRRIFVSETESIPAPKRLNKYGEWLVAMEGKPGYIVIKDRKAVLK